MTTGLVAFCLILLAGSLAAGTLVFWVRTHGRRREGLYDLLYSLRWGQTTTNNYGFAPAETGDVECFQLQLYAELLKLLGAPAPGAGIERVLEISCGRGGGLRHAALLLPDAQQVIGLDFSMHAIGFCRTHYAALPNVGFVRGHALQLPFADGAFDLVVNVEASHAYGDEAAFLGEVRRVLRPGGRLLYGDHRTRRKIARLEQRLRAAGFAGAAARHHGERGARVRAGQRAAPGADPIRAALVVAAPRRRSARAVRRDSGNRGLRAAAQS